MGCVVVEDWGVGEWSCCCHGGRSEVGEGVGVGAWGLAQAVAVGATSDAMYERSECIAERVE